MKRNPVVFALAFVFLTSTSNPQAETLPQYDSLKISTTKKYCGEMIFGKNGKLTPCAKYFYEKGEPTGSAVFPGLNKAGEDFNYFQYSWEGEVVMMKGSQYPEKVCPKPSLFQGIGGNFPQGPTTLSPRTRTFQSVDSAGWRSIIYVTEIGLGELNAQTYGSSRIRYSAEISEIVENYNESTGESKFSKRTVLEGDYNINLKQDAWIAGFAANIEDYVTTHKLHIPLRAGIYEFKMRVAGEDGCRGEAVDTIIVAKEEDDKVEISDILVYDPNHGTGYLDRTIKRWDTTGLWPVANFFEGSQATAFVEAKAGTSGEYLIEVWLAPFVFDTTLRQPVERKVIFSKMLNINESVAVSELTLDFKGITPGIYSMGACLSQIGGVARDESACLIRVKEGKSQPESNPSPPTSLAEMSPLNYDSIISEFTDSELRAFFKIEDEDLFTQIDTVTNPELFRANVIWYLKKKDIATFRGDTEDKNEWWEEKAEILRWGKTNLKTTIDATLCDARWWWVVKHGIKNFDGSQSLASRPGDDVPTYLLRWKSGLEVEFQALAGGSIPMKFKVLKPGSELVMKDVLGRSGEGDKPASIDYGAILDASRASNEALSQESHSNVFEGIDPLDGWATLSFLFDAGDPENEKGQTFSINGSGLFPISSFTDSALASDTLRAQIVVYDSSGEFVGKVDEVGWGLKDNLGLSKEVRRTKAFPAYIRMYIGLTYPTDKDGEVELGRLSAGKYTVNLTFSADGGRQLGMIERDLEIPPRTMSLEKVYSGIWGTSDIIFATRLVDETGLGVYMNGEHFYNSPLSVFPTTDRLPIVLQSKTPPNEDFLVLVILVQDKGEDIFKQITAGSAEEKDDTVSVRQFRADDYGLTLIKDSLDLSVLKPGRAAVVVRILDPSLDPDSDDQPNVISYRRFLVVKPK